jgi:multidrug resistance efflux pump
MQGRSKLLLAGFIAAGAMAGAAALFYRDKGTPEGGPIPGMVRQTEIRVAPEISGRLASIGVRPGQHVRKGEVLAVLDNPDLAASVEEAKAAAASAKADRDHVYAGARREEVAIAAEAVRTAEANLLLAQQQNTRAVALSARGYSSRQQLDESKAEVARAQADLDLKRAQLTSANAGPTAEERALADARVALAEATVADFQAKFDKTTLRAPVDATLGIRVAELGEILSPGQSVMTIEADGQRWFTFTLREDALGGLTVGGAVSLETNIGHPVEARVTELRPLGEFATWRAARAVGDHDLNSFRLRLDPTTDVEGLEPGMTVWLTPQS